MNKLIEYKGHIVPSEYDILNPLKERDIVEYPHRLGRKRDGDICPGEVYVFGITFGGRIADICCNNCLFSQGVAQMSGLTVIGRR